MNDATIVDTERPTARAESNTAQLPVVPALQDVELFKLANRKATALAASQLMPERFRGNVADCLIVLEMAERIGASALMVAQNLYIVHGTPAWSAQFVISCINSCGRYASLRYEIKSDQPKSDDYKIRAWTVEKGNDERLYGPWIDWEIVRSEGWDIKKGSKWKTIPELMFRYRAAAWWGRTNAPDLTMGLRTVDEEREMIDITPRGGSDVMREINDQVQAAPELLEAEPAEQAPVDNEPDYAAMIAAAKSLDDLDTIGDMLDDMDESEASKKLRDAMNARRVELSKD